jgi:replicative DNA helicase
VPAHDLDAEAVVLSALLVSPDRFCDVQPILTSRAFYSDANRRIFEAIEDLDRDGKGIDVTAIATVLRDQDRLAQVGGTPYLAQLLEATPATAHVEDHARTVAGKAHQRRLVAELQTHAAEGYGDVGNPWDWAQRVEEAVYRVSAERLAESEDGTLAAVVPEVLDEVQARARGEAEPPGISTGFRLLDERINGLKRAKTYVVAGRPGMGKTALIGQIGTNIAAGAEPMFVVEISTEQKRSELALRKLAQCSGVAYTALEAGRISADGWERVVVESERLRKLPLAIEYMVAPTVGELRSAVRRALGRLRKAFGSLPIGLLSFDQIQHFDGKRSRGETRESEVAQLSREITWLAGEFDCPVMLAAQLNRGVEERPDKRPVPSDLRESGAIEQDAYGIFFPFRPRYYERQERGVSNSESVAVEECEVIIGKHKNGPAGSVAFTFHGPSMAFDTPDEYARAGAQQAMSFRGEQPPEDG